ncbi:MAG TPA: aminotransferase class I/II-fold pyridoxal phosphate-dependent enzyme [Acidimicrobiales bacterium]|nr:aminotransferase class I/II-fold pyridoxal phosphate-dependent enzyme [Acidimicrobiales bacterium]
MATKGWEPPPYPYDRLEPMKEKANAHDGGAVDLSVGTPNDPPPPFVVEALATSNAERGYPPSIGSLPFRTAAAEWMQRRFAVEVGVTDVAACIGTKEFVASVPQYLKLRSPDRDTVLYPAISYPTYEMGATLAGCRAVAVPVDEHWRIDLSAISDDDASRALCLWVNSPGNPAGNLDDLGAAAAWGRAHEVPVFSDECYAEFTWDDRPRTILEHGIDGVVAVHSLSKRSNLAGARAGFYAGDTDIVHYLEEVRKHAGFMVPGPVQAAAVAALGDDEHVDQQRARYRERMVRMAQILSAWTGADVRLPGGSFYLWVSAPNGDAWGFAERIAAEGGALITPGDTFGAQGAGHVRIALVQPMDRIELVAERLSV